MNGHLKFAALYLAVALSTAGPATFAHQQKQPPANILPKQFGKWMQDEGPADQPRPIPPTSPLLQESGQSSTELQNYTNGKQWLQVWVEEFRDPSGAYQAYTSFLNPNLNPSTVAPLTAAGDDQLLALVGNRLLKVSWIKNATDADLKLLLTSVKQKADRTPLPPIRAYLPEQQLIQGTQRYALGPVGFDAALDSLGEPKYSALTPEVGFKSGAEAVFAAYSAGHNQAQHLLIIDYPTPQLAEQHLRHLQPLLAANPALAGTTVERKASLLSLVLSPGSAEAVARLRDQINYETQVTWNEPSQTLTDPPWLTVVKDIFIGTLFFCGMALVLGVAFGGVRVLTKRFFPGKVFDRPQDMEVLQLGLSGKRIDPRDFY
jgi:hypothetical protein